MMTLRQLLEITDTYTTISINRHDAGMSNPIVDECLMYELSFVDVSTLLDTPVVGISCKDGTMTISLMPLARPYHRSL